MTGGTANLSNYGSAANLMYKSDGYRCNVTHFQ